MESEVGVWRASMGVWTARWGCGERGGGVESEAGVWGARWGCGERGGGVESEMGALRIIIILLHPVYLAESTLTNIV